MVTCINSRGRIGKEMATGNVTVNTARSTSLLSEGMGTASDVDTGVGTAVMSRGGGVIVRLVHCRFLFHPVSYKEKWIQIWDTAYDNTTGPGEDVDFLLFRLIWCPCCIDQG